VSEYAVETADLARRYGAVRSVDGIDLRVTRQGIYGFLGPNGAGKTTTLRLLLGLIRPSAGTVRVFGRDLRQERMAILREVGALVESPSYYPQLTAEENLAILATLLRLPRDRITEVLGQVRLDGVARRRVGGFSLGMKQRLGIAAALLNRPRLLILDEPTNGLDPAGIQEIRTLIRSLPESGITVIVSSHLLTEVEQVATEVGIIHHGRLLFQGDINELRRRQAARLIFEVDDQKTALHALSGMGEAVAAGDGSELILPYLERKQAAASNRTLVQAGCAVYAMRVEQPSLEDLFLSLVGAGESL